MLLNLSICDLFQYENKRAKVVCGESEREQNELNATKCPMSTSI